MNGTRAAAPVAIFAFNRPLHLQRTIAALAANRLAPASAVTVFVDGPRSAVDRPGVAAVRDVLSGWMGKRAFASFDIVVRERNRGLAESLIGGIGEILARHERVVVVEDDIVTSPHFLDFCNDGLELYADDPRVASVHGYIYPLGVRLPETFFLRGASCWGWATWRRAWKHFEPDGRVLLRDLRQRGAITEFDVAGSYPFTRMLREQIQGGNHSWAIRWRASAWLAGMHTLYPGRSLVENIGFDGSGTHCEPTGDFAQQVGTEPIALARQAVCEDAGANLALAGYFTRIMHQPGWRAVGRKHLEGIKDRWQPLRGPATGRHD